MKNKKKIAIEDALCFNLYSTSRAMTQVYRPYLKKLNLTYPQFLVMLLLWENSDKQISVKDLGQRLFLDSGTLTPLLKRIENMDFITRKRSVDDEREVLIGLTKKGKLLEKKCSDIPMAMFCNLDVTMERFTEIRDGVAEVLSNLHNKLEK